MTATFAVMEWFPPILNVLIWLVSVFLILLILIQKGKGGGLAGAFGGPGGQSAFGSKTADAFTKITLYVAGVWVALIIVMIWLVQPKSVISSPNETPVITKDGTPIEGAPKSEAETSGETKEGSKETPKDDSPKVEPKVEKKEPVKEVPKVEPKVEKKEPVKEVPKVEPKGSTEKGEIKKN